MIDQYDEREIYCRKLGHCLQFSYCRRAQGQAPCRSILDCWTGKLPVRDYLLAHHRENIEAILTPPAPKIASILEIAERIEMRLAGSGPKPG